VEKIAVSVLHVSWGVRVEEDEGELDPSLFEAYERLSRRTSIEYRAAFYREEDKEL
jgi:hypothetical protein